MSCWLISVEAAKRASRGEQLELFDLREVTVRVPWEGRDLLGLTSRAGALYLRHGPQKSMSDLVAAGQYDLWPTNQQGPYYVGAPSLLPLPWEA